LPDGTADALAIDSAGRWEWTNNADEVVLDGVNYSSNGTASPFGTGKARHNIVFPSNAPIAANVNIFVSHGIPNGNLLNPDSAIAGSCMLYPYSSNTKVGLQFVTNDSISSDALMNTWLQSNPVTVLYPLATPTTEHGYIRLPSTPAGCVVSIPELENVSISWFVAGAAELVEHAKNWHKREDLESRVEALEAAIAEIATA
jgi:hypothetical protein